MRFLKFYGVVVAALFSLSASAQTQNVPVSCDWEHVSSQSGPSAATITFQCEEADGSVAATRQLTYSAPSWQVSYCSISLATGVFNSGTCQNTSLYRVEQVTPPPPSTCTTPGLEVYRACGNSLASGALNYDDIVARCGSGCELDYESVGFTEMCPNSGVARSPEISIFCK